MRLPEAIIAACVVGAVVVLAGCGASYGGPPVIAIGTGPDSFVPLADGDAIPIVHGTQGGYHVWGSIRAREVDPHGLALRFTLVIDGDAAMGTAPLSVTVRDDRVDLDLAGSGSDAIGTHAGTVVFLPDPAAVRGRSCRFRVAATDAGGRHATDEKRVVPFGP